MHITNSQASNNRGDCLRLTSSGGDVNPGTAVLWAETNEGSAGLFDKSTDDDAYALQVLGASATSEGLYVDGTIVSTAPPARSVVTGRGRDIVFGVQSPDAEIYSSGTARLSSGEAQVSFDPVFAAAVSSQVELKVTVTPVGGWSALYVVDKSAEGFTVRSASGDASVEFDWVACGRAAGFETKPEVTIPSAD
jgi:hypothetical protein